MAQTHKLVIGFRSMDALLDFAADHCPEGTAVYQADGLDKEFGGRAPANSYVLRNIGAKPDKFLAARDVL